MTINVRAMPDVEAPFWRSSVDLAALYETHRKPGAIDLMCDRAMVDPDDTLFPDQFVPMSRRILPLLSNETNYCFTFSPRLDDDPAIVFPGYAEGDMVGLLAICAHDTALWTCVTGRGGSRSGNFAAGQPVRVHKEEPWRWLLFGCDDVAVLNKDAYPEPLTHIVVHGHTITDTRRPLVTHNRIALDTGAYGT
jgi:hypothetical protein